MLRILLVSLAVAQAKDVPNGHEIEAPGLASSQTSWVDLTRKITMVMKNGAGAVVGAAVGGAVGLLLVVGAILYCSIFLACCACCPCNKKKGQA